MKLTKKEQLNLLESLPPNIKKKITKMANVEGKRGQGGAGLKSILSKARALLGPIAGVIGPIALREFVIKPGIKSLLGSGKPKPRRKTNNTPASRLQMT